MYKIYGLLILNLITTLDIGYALHLPWSPETVKSELATEEDVKSLAVITTKQALPIILHAAEDDKNLWLPEKLIRAKIKHGRLVSGTTFYAKLKKPQIFFCPNPDGTENCLVPTKFKRWQVLECKKEPFSVLQKNTEMPECGSDGKGRAMRITFDICSAKKHYKFDGYNLITYHFCYDESAKKTLFVRYTLTSLRLHEEKLLSREREVQFPLYIDLISNDPVLLEAAIKYESQYTLQKLVPTEDLPFLVLRKTTHHVVNIALQHKKLVKLWDTICNYVRNNAIGLATMGKWAPHYQKIITGVIDIPKNEIPNAMPEDQMGNIWVKIVYTIKRYSANQGVAILMNNFIVDERKLGNEQYIDKICGQDSCTSSLKEEFAEAGGQVRCCEVTDAILNLFFTNKAELKIGFKLPVFQINYTY